MVIIVNIVTLCVLGTIFALLVTMYLKNAFFSISILYNFTIFLSPFIITIVNLIFLYKIHSSKIPLAFLPLVIPILYFFHNKIQNYTGHKSFLRLKEFSKEVIFLAGENNIHINSEDIRIRIKQRKNISVIFNVYSTNDEKLIRSMREEFHQLISNNFKHYQVEILIDKKKNEQHFNLTQYN